MPSNDNSGFLNLGNATRTFDVQPGTSYSVAGASITLAGTSYTPGTYQLTFSGGGSGAAGTFTVNGSGAGGVRLGECRGRR